MMGVAPDAADHMDLWEYEALLFHWNESHGGGEPTLPKPDPMAAQRILDKANANPKLTGQPAAA